jgi:DNA-binding transcriptional MerR regulator
MFFRDRLSVARGLSRPPRTAAGWRSYGASEILRGRAIVELRRLGLSLKDVGRVLDGDGAVLERALAAHEAALEARVGELGETVRRVRHLRDELSRKAISTASALSQSPQVTEGTAVAFDLPWPWGGEWFELRPLRKLTYIVGPLGSGKTRLAMQLAQSIDGARFVGLDRLEKGAGTDEALLAADPRLERRVRDAVAAIEDTGGSRSSALVALLTAIEAETSSAQVVDMLEQGLDTATQEALMCFLRRRAHSAKPLIFLTRSSAILDVDTVGENETIVFCPANHAPPFAVAPYRGAAGYEALVTCLATPAVRARTEGVVAVRRNG